MAVVPDRARGVLTAWNDDRGFGFITLESTASESDRVFLHISAFPRGIGRPVLGETLSFTIDHAADGRTLAREVAVERAAADTAHETARPAARRRPGSFDYLAIIGFFLVFVFASVLWPMPPWVAGVYLVTSVLSFVVYAVDKRAATTGGWRVSESSLLALGLIGGWPGAIVGQQVFRHKTRKVAFRSAFWGTVVLNVLAFVTFSAVLSAQLAGVY
jgi:uncharacterized membrane protein YsdA (DUF1294 family)/cold shock CspA family protein